MAILAKAKGLLGSKPVTTTKSAIADYVDFAKNNPRAAVGDVALAGLAMCGVSATNSLNEIEDAAELSAAVDLHEFFGS